LETTAFDIQNKPDFATTIAALQLQDSSTPASVVFYGLSGLTTEEIENLRPVWEKLSPALRRKILHEMVELTETNVELNYHAIGHLSLGDTDPHVREAAIEVLWEDESLELLSRLNDLALHDDNREVRATAASAFGRFVFLVEMGDLPDGEAGYALQTATSIYRNAKEDISVRRRALEAMGNTSAEIVAKAIKSAYRSTEREMQISAVYAMGRTCDERWAKIVMEEIENEDAEMRYEAARASGQLELGDAVPKLADLLLDDDREVQLAAVWALGEIGGKESIHLLTLLAEKAQEEEDEDLLEASEEALGSASLLGDDLPSLWALEGDVDYADVDDDLDD